MMIWMWNSRWWGPDLVAPLHSAQLTMRRPWPNLQGSQGPIIAVLYKWYNLLNLNKSSVAQLASASDCYTSGYQEVGSSSLPGGGLFFCLCCVVST